MAKKRGPASRPPQSSSPSVSVVACDDYAEPGLSLAIRRCLEPLGGIRAFVRLGDRVLLKPNLISPKPPEAAACTQPEVARAVALAVLEAGGEPFFGDSPGGRPSPGNFEKAMERSGIAAVARGLGVETVRFDDDAVTLSYPQGRVFKRFEVARAAVEADAVVTLPRLKTHNLTGLTAGVKILYGCVPGYRKVGYHVTAGREGIGRFAELLVDLTAALGPRLTLLDAVVAMEGEGPTSGRPRRVGALLASADPFALDWMAAELVGVPPMDVPTVAAAARAGLGPGSINDVKIFGEPLELPRVRDFVMPAAWDPAERLAPFFRAAARAFAPRPRILRERCVNCNVCVDGCPTGALMAGEPTPRYVHAKCIRCYCCAEFCPHEAVEIVRPLTG